MMMNETLDLNFEYQLLSEMPGRAFEEIVYVPNDGSGMGRDGVMIKFLPESGKRWIGVFAFGDMLPDGECRVYPGPGRSQLTILAKGDAYIVSPDNPASFVCVKSCPVIHAVPVPRQNLMLFHDYTEIVAYSERGLAWETARISWDGIKIDEVSDTKIFGKGWDAPNEKHVEFSVDLANGSHIGGSSPPNYPTS
ncbi:MAG: hypothetical protein ABJN40_00020 [Sneathiella sp.]